MFGCVLLLLLLFLLFYALSFFVSLCKNHSAEKNPYWFFFIFIFPPLLKAGCCESASRDGANTPLHHFLLSAFTCPPPPPNSCLPCRRFLYHALWPVLSMCVSFWGSGAGETKHSAFAFFSPSLFSPPSFSPSHRYLHPKRVLLLFHALQCVLSTSPCTYAHVFFFGFFPAQSFGLIRDVRCNQSLWGEHLRGIPIVIYNCP